MRSASGGLPNVLTRLKLETAPAHRRLESDLGLSRETVSEPRIRRLLERFHGFYRVWEPWVASSGLDETFFGPRRKLALVETDLRALGVAEPHLLPAYPFLLGPATLEQAMGSLYVIEGSMLGGQVIRRWIMDAPWQPGGGFAYFNAYGSDVGRMWRSVQERLLSLASVAGEDGIVRAASLTFEGLHGWLCAREEQA